MRVMRRIVVCGESLIDLVPTAPAGDTRASGWRALSAGGPMNTAIGLARLGNPVEFLGRLGDDAFAGQLRRHLAANGVGTALAVGAAVAAVGSVGFVGLVVPHLLRPLVRYQPSKLLIPSALGGALLVTVADIFIRVVSARSELMLGVVTSLLGAPFFLFLIIQMRRGKT